MTLMTFYPIRIFKSKTLLSMLRTILKTIDYPRSSLRVLGIDVDGNSAVYSPENINNIDYKKNHHLYPT